jgi:hypothetical protein
LALVGDDAVDTTPGVLRMGFGMDRGAVRDRSGDIIGRHHAVARLESAAVATAVIYQIDPSRLRAAPLRLVERVRDEPRQLRARRCIPSKPKRGRY